MKIGAGMEISLSDISALFSESYENLQSASQIISERYEMILVEREIEKTDFFERAATIARRKTDYF
jgi:hypothetical protein